MSADAEAVPVTQDRIIRPSTRLSFDDICREYNEIQARINEADQQLEVIRQELESLNAAYPDDVTCSTITEKERTARKIRNSRDKDAKMLDALDLNVYKEAFGVLETGDPVKYLMDTYSRLHLSDTALGMVLLLSIANTVITNSQGLQPKGSGESGKGKTHAFEAVFSMIPEHYKLAGSLSSKSLYYNEDLIDGIIMFSDDIKMNDDLESTLKQAMGSFQKNTYHNTLIKEGGKFVYAKMELPKRICWWLTSVNTDFSDELINRLFDVSVDDSADTDKAVTRKIFDDSADDTGSLEDDDIKVCQAMIDIIKRQLFKVKIPFGKSISWNMPGDRRNPSRFVSLVYGFAVLRHLQREEIDGYTIAAIEDFEDAKALYEDCKGSQISKLTATELRLVEWIYKQNKALTINDIQDGFTKKNGEKYAYKSIQRMIWGDPNKGSKGLIDKVAMEVSENARDRRYYIKEFKKITGEVVTLNR